MSNFLVPYAQTMREYTDAPPIFHQATAVTMMGALLTRQPYRCIVQAGVGGTWTNFWSLLVGDSGTDRKSEAIKMAMHSSINTIDPSLKAPDDMSPEGLLAFLKHRDQLETNASGLMVQAEFIHLLHQFKRQWSASLRPILLKLYDVEDVYKRQLKKEEYEIHFPRISLIGGIPPEILARYGQPEDWDGGFFNRFLILQGKKEREQLAPPNIPEKVLSTFSTKLSVCLDRWKLKLERRNYSHLTLSKDAQRVGSQLRTKDKDFNLNTMLARTFTHFLKVAAIAQVDIDPESSTIERPAAEYAAELIQVWQNGLPDIVGLCRTSGREEFEGNKLAKFILRYLTKNGPTSEKTLKRLVVNDSAFMSARLSLMEANLITFEGEGTGIMALTKL